MILYDIIRYYTILYDIIRYYMLYYYYSHVYLFRQNLNQIIPKMDLGDFKCIGDRIQKFIMFWTNLPHQWNFLQMRASHISISTKPFQRPWFTSDDGSLSLSSSKNTSAENIHKPDT
jgi:hypothetical protein